MTYPDGKSMNALRNIHEVRFTNIEIILNITLSNIKLLDLLIINFLITLNIIRSFH